MMHHEQRVLHVEQDLTDHRHCPPEKGAKSRIIQDYCEKEAYLQYEVSSKRLLLNVFCKQCFGTHTHTILDFYDFILKST